MSDYVFRLKGRWKGSWDGRGQIQVKNLASAISVDSSMKGMGIGTNPDELLLGALASCYMMTLGIRLDKEKIAYERLLISSELVVTKQGGLHVERVIHRPVVELAEKPTEALRDRLKCAIRQAEKDCMIAKAVRGNVRITVEPIFTEKA
ncbi:MAG: OsmC family protein [Sporolactobacillus sp.]|jgi:peroxiredoxin-like protein|nr:OsmC family protein [Sporolactobacillus sp.]